MCKLLIFGGTTEGRLLAEFCAEHNISADVSVTTDRAAELLPDCECIGILNGKLDRAEMRSLLAGKKYRMAIDATHPYAVEATRNITSACNAAGIPYYRLLREQSADISGTTFGCLEEIIKYLNSSDKIILSTLGSKELYALAGVRGYSGRVWARLLPAEGILEKCRLLGFDEKRIITASPPFSVEENIKHIKLSGAEILVTKESGAAGGYPEKAEAARECGAELVTLLRPKETGYTPEQIRKIVMEIKEWST